MSVNPRQIKLVQDSFVKVEPIAEQAAEIFYATLFKYDPSLKAMFASDMKSQGQKLMATLKIAVNSLNNLERLVPVLEELAERHVRYGVTVEHYTTVGNALLATLKQGLGEQWTPELRKAWLDTVRLVVKVMKEHAYPGYKSPF